MSRYADARAVAIRTDDGVRLVAHRLGPASGEPVLLLPGTFSNASFWLGTRGVGFARFLADRGYCTWSLDPRGHGDSDRQPPGERWSFDQWGRQDAVAAIRTLAAADGRPLRAVGHSAGGAALLTALAAEPVLRDLMRAIVIVATPLPWLQPWHRAAARSVRALCRVLPRFPARRLGFGSGDEPAGVMAQWMEWNLTRRWVGDDGTDYLRRFADIRTPVLGVVGAGERFWAPPPACRALIEALGSHHSAFVVAGRESGFRHDFGHVDILVGRSARDEVWPLLADAFTRPAPAPSGVAKARQVEEIQGL
jgi:predicted alpha/beta hydrolase